MSQIVLPPEERLERFRAATARARESIWRDLCSQINDERQAQGIPRSIGGGAPTPATTLAVIRAAKTTNTFTGPATLLSDDARGTFNADWFNVVGATFKQEAMGTLSVTGTPTFSFSTQWATSVGGSYTSLCSNTATAAGSGIQNVNWYYSAFGSVKAAAGAATTVLVTGILTWDIATLGTFAQLWVRNANPPTAVTVSLATGAVSIDLQGTFSASSASNTVTVNYYTLASFML